MSLINCPECNKEISDKAEKCIHCGYPLQQSNLCKINGKEFDLSFLLDDSYSILYKVRDLIQISGSDITHVKPEVEKIIQCKKIPRYLNLPLKKSNDDITPKCPHCKSTNIKSISGLKRGASIAMLGMFSKKINKSFECLNCKYTW